MGLFKGSFPTKTNKQDTNVLSCEEQLTKKLPSD